MRFGHFDDAKREYVIETPRTPLPWINYLGSEDFFALVSNTAGGYAFYRDARLRRLTRYRYNNCPLDSDGFHVYIKDGDTVWNPGWQPTQTELDEYECRHGLGYTILCGSKNGIAVRQEMLVPKGDNCLLTRLTVTNESPAKRAVSLFPYAEFCLWDAMDDSSNFQRNFSIGEVELEPNAIYHKTEYRERRDHYAVLWADRPYEGFDTSRDAFMGVYGAPSMPQAVKNGACTGSVAHGWAPVGAMQFTLSLAPGASQTLLLGLGYIENPEDAKWSAPGVINKEPAHALLREFQTDAQFEEKLAALKAYWAGLLNHFHVDSPDEKLNRQVNLWNQYQCMVTFNMSRSASYFESGIGRGMGFRDCSQDLLGFIHLIPERARDRILDIAATQFPDGSAYHQYQPLTKCGNMDVGSGFNDDPLWLIYAVSAYIKETGDLSILSEKVDFDNDPAQAQTMMVHLKRSFHYIAEHKGPHKLPLIGRADWNDCLNLNCFSAEPGESFQTVTNNDTGIAESVFIAGMYVGVADDYARLCDLTGETEEAAFVRAEKAAMIEAVEKDGWDGEWFLRAYDAFGHKVGSDENKEGKIFIEPQGMCVMAGIGVENGMAQKAMDASKKYLEFEYGDVLLWPAYTEYHLELGEISSYPPGYKENGSVFCHNNPWIMIAQTVLGHGDAAFDLYRKIAPAYIEDQQLHRTEPYVYAQTVNGKESYLPGEAKNSWLTGTSAWNFFAISQAILGVKPQFDGLMIDPCLPASLPEVTIRREFRGSVYDIHIVNRAGGEKAPVRITVDGQPIDGQVIPLPAKPGAHLRVEVKS